MLDVCVSVGGYSPLFPSAIASVFVSKKRIGDPPPPSRVYRMLNEIRTHGLASDMLPTLRDAWTARAKTLARQRYDRYGDLLYAYLLDLLVPQKESTFATLMAKIQTAATPKDVEVPLWTYTACYSKVKEEPLFDTRIGTKLFGGVSALPPVSVYAVVHNTDVLYRLASAYGADFHVYDRFSETLSESDQRVQTRRTVMLAYYPHGLPEVLAKQVQEAYAAQIGRSPYTPSWAESLSVADPLQTPAQSPPSSPPRHRRRRCSCESY